MLSLVDFFITFASIFSFTANLSVFCSALDFARLVLLMTPFLSLSNFTIILSLSILLIIPVTILLIVSSDFEGSDDNCLIPNETLSLSKSISRILNLTSSSTL